MSCGRLSGPTNGDVSFTSTSVNSKATYSCNNGFLLVGQTTRVCQSNGEWSGIAPACKSKTEHMYQVFRKMYMYERDVLRNLLKDPILILDTNNS